MLVCFSTLNACSKPAKKELAHLPALNSTETFNLEKKAEMVHSSASKKAPSKESKVAGSKAPGKWIYSSDKSIACRVKEWSVTGTKELPNSNIYVEVANLKSKKPVNAVYELLAIDTNGQVIRTISNAYKDNQPNITEFKPLLGKGQTKVNHIYRKDLLVMSTLNLQKCRVAGDKESFLTINPEMKDYVGP